MRILRFGSIGDDVRRVQARLQTLGYYTLGLDGRFGPGTETAVKRFQVDRGLAVDGVVGLQTCTALGISGESGDEAGGAGSAPAARRRISLHIGVNHVDASQYNGWDGALSGCENDAATMVEIAAAEGFAARPLLSGEATSTNVLAGITAAAGELEAGDIFLLTYAGHGAQLPDAGGDEGDRQDETWVLFDRMLIDDELEAAFSAFAPGTDIVMLSDSCHSGTVFRSMFSTEQQSFAELKNSFYLDVVSPGTAGGATAGTGSGRSFPRPAAAGTRGRNDTGQADELFRRAQAEWGGDLSSTRGYSWRDLVSRPEVSRGMGSGPSGAPQRVPGATATATVRDVAGLEASLGNTVVVRAMPLAVNADVVVRQARRYAELRESVRSRGAVSARGLAISGCQDAQLSQEVGGHGVFTTAVQATWAEGRFVGSYGDFHQQILPRMGPTQTPELSGFGQDPGRLRAKEPFG